MIDSASTTCYPRIVEPWVLRNDQNNFVLYKNSAAEIQYLVLSPLQAIIAPFLNGKYSAKELSSIWLELTKPFQPEVIPFRTIIGELIDEGIVSDYGRSSLDIEESPLFIPDLLRYVWPVERTTQPLTALVSLTNTCDASCKYCYAERKRIVELSKSDWFTVFDKLSAAQMTIVDIGGGDPFCRQDILELLEEMLRRKFVFNVSTKSYIDSDRAAVLGALDWDTSSTGTHQFQISVDSIDDSIASSMAGIRNHVYKTKRSLKNLMAEGVTPRIKCVLTPGNLSGIERFVEEFGMLGVESFQFVQYGRSLYRHDDSLFLSLSQKKSLSNQFKKIIQSYSDLHIVYQDDTSISNCQFTSQEWNDRVICTGGRSALLIMPNGDVTLCDQLPHEDAFIVGNIISDDLDTIWNSNKLDSFIHPSKSKFEGSVCFECDDFSECHHGKGYCYRDSYLAFGTLYTAPPSCHKQSASGKRML